MIGKSLQTRIEEREQNEQTQRVLMAIVKAAHRHGEPLRIPLEALEDVRPGDLIRMEVTDTHVVMTYHVEGETPGPG